MSYSRLALAAWVVDSGRRMAGLFAVAAFIEMIVLGTTIGAVYRPVGVGPAGRRDAGV